MSSQSTPQQLQLAIERALTYEKCLLELEDMAKRACQYDKALANVGALFSQQVDGRVSTEVDPDVAYDTDAIITRAKHLMTLYEELGIKRNRVIMRIPATWEGIQAAGKLEAQGINTHLVLVYSFVQGAAAAQAGVSVIQPNVGRIYDWYCRHPGVVDVCDVTR